MDLNTSNTRNYVLVIDDEAPVRDAVTDILHMIGVEVITAVNGLEGIRYYQQQQAQIKVVLLDYSMPGLGGEETLRELCRINPDVRVIFSSGYGEMEVIDRIGRKENVSYLQKPYNLTQLLEEVSKYLDNGSVQEN